MILIFACLIESVFAPAFQIVNASICLFSALLGTFIVVRVVSTKSLKYLRAYKKVEVLRLFIMLVAWIIVLASLSVMTRETFPIGTIISLSFFCVLFFVAVNCYSNLSLSSHALGLCP